MLHRYAPGDLALMSGIAGVYFVGRAIYVNARSNAAMHWLPVDAEIISATVAESQWTRSWFYRYRPEISFQYVVNGTLHQSSRLHPVRNPRLYTKDTASQMAAQYEPGMRLHAHYDPANPDQAVLIRTADESVSWELLGGVGSLLLFLFARHNHL